LTWPRAATAAVWRTGTKGSCSDKVPPSSCACFLALPMELTEAASFGTAAAVSEHRTRLHCASTVTHTGVDHIRLPSAGVTLAKSIMLAWPRLATRLPHSPRCIRHIRLDHGHTAARHSARPDTLGPLPLGPPGRLAPGGRTSQAEYLVPAVVPAGPRAQGAGGSRRTPQAKFFVPAVWSRSGSPGSGSGLFTASVPHIPIQS